jgi:hypothetical protein
VQPTPAERIGHIATAISDIRDIVTGQTFESFATDLTRRRAVERAGLKDLAEGQRITFEVEPDKKGKGPKAVNLVISS